MSRNILVTVGVLGCLSIAACHKAVPVASAPAVKAPVDIAPAKQQNRPAPAPQQTATNRQAPRQAQQNNGPRTLTPQERTTLNERLAHLEDALFDYDKAAIRPDAMSALREDVDVIRGILSNYPSQKLVIEGHADERGSTEYNMALGDKRAASAEDLLTMMGIPKAQLTVISYGKERPVCTQTSEECWQRNRRAHITAAP